MTNEYEVKRTLSDYAQDFKKGCGEEKKHELIQSGGRTNKFWYVLPESLVVELPEYAGVIRYKQDEEGHINLRKVRNAKILHKQKLSECPKLLYNIALKCYYRMLNIQKEQHSDNSLHPSRNIRKGNMQIATEMLAKIYESYLDNRLDECRPEWNNGLEKDLQIELYTGRGGRCLLTLQDCKNAYDKLHKGDIRQ
jgi:hypothetical protein